MATGKRAVENPLEYEIILYEDAKNDVIEITKWYDLQSDGGLGDKFEKCLDEAIQKLTANTFVFSLLFKDVRRIKLKVFPYIIFYEVKESAVHIYGVIHTKRNPNVYKKRLRKLQ